MNTSIKKYSRICKDSCSDATLEIVPKGKKLKLILDSSTGVIYLNEFNVITLANQINTWLDDTYYGE